MEYTVQVEEYRYRVEVLDGAKLNIVRLDDEGEALGEAEQREAKLLSRSGVAYSYVDGCRHESVSVIPKDQGDFDVFLPGERALSCHVVDPFSAHLGGDAEGKASGSVVSSMPGIVLRVFVTEGDVISKGDRLLVLEAMKTENEICAELDGIVSAVHVTDGVTVADGARLIEIEPDADDD